MEHRIPTRPRTTEIKKKARALAFLTLTSAGCQLFQDPVSPERPMEVPVAPAEPSGGAPATEQPEPAVAPDPLPDEPAIQPTGGPTRGRLSREAIARVVTENMPRLRTCYEAGLARNPALSAGTVMVNFVIAPDGAVPYAAALQQGTDLTDDAVIDCILDEFQKLTFDAPEGGRVVSTYPLRFEPEPPER